MEEIIDQKYRRGQIGWLAAMKDTRKGRETEIAQLKKGPTTYRL